MAHLPPTALAAGRGTGKSNGWMLRVETLEHEIERRVVILGEASQRLLTIPGIDRKTAWTIVAEWDWT